MSAVVYGSAILLYVMGGARCQGIATIAISTNPVYSGELVVLSCRFGEDNTLTFATIDAFNHTSKEGSLRCRVPRPNVTGYGVLSRNSMSGCPSTIPGSADINMSMTASPSLELDFNCTALVTNVDSKQYTLASGTTSLVVYVLPSAPKLEPDPLVFNENDAANIVCESHNGKPASSVILTVTSLNGSRLAASGIGSASLSLSSPLINWHNATATCNVANHKFSNMTTSSNVLINHVKCASGPQVVAYDSKNTWRDCSMYISCYPAPKYTWSVSPKIDAAAVESLLEVRNSTFDQRQPVIFNCTATNDVARKAAVVLITVNNSRHSNSTLDEPNFGLSTQCSLKSMPFAESFLGDEKPSEMHGIACSYIVPPVIVLTVTVLISLIVHRKRKIVLKKRERLVAQLQASSKSFTFTGDEKEMTAMVDNDLYSGARTHQSNDAEQHLCNREETINEELFSESLAVAISDKEEHQYALLCQP